MEILYLLFLVILADLVWSHPHSQTIQHTREFLLNLQWNRQIVDPTLSSRISNINREIISDPVITRNDFKKVAYIRKRGRKGGVRQRIRKQLQNNCIPLPSIILANVQSLRNKTDELHGNISHLREYRDVCIMAFTETWLTAADSDASLDMTGFGPPVRLDRDIEVTQKTQGGGVCLYINRRWCNNFTVQEQLCLPDIQLLSVSVRPFYLQREFPQVFVTVVYILWCLTDSWIGVEASECERMIYVRSWGLLGSDKGPPLLVKPDVSASDLQKQPPYISRNVLSLG